MGHASKTMFVLLKATLLIAIFEILLEAFQ